MTGYSEEELIGQSPRILQGPETDLTVIQELKDCISNGLFCKRPLNPTFSNSLIPR